MVLGFLLSAQLVKFFTPVDNIKIGAVVAFMGILFMLCEFVAKELSDWGVFIPMIIIFLGEAVVLNNSASYATAKSEDKSNASALLSFINMGVATISVLIANLIGSNSILLLPIFYLLLITIIWICK